jgi:hypothetical protein
MIGMHSMNFIPEKLLTSQNLSSRMNIFIAFIKEKAKAKAKKNKTLSRRSGILLSLK